MSPPDFELTDQDRQAIKRIGDRCDAVIVVLGALILVVLLTLLATHSL